jgi:hypothetical protein
MNLAEQNTLMNFAGRAQIQSTLLASERPYTPMIIEFQLTSLFCAISLGLVCVSGQSQLTLSVNLQMRHTMSKL